MPIITTSSFVPSRARVTRMGGNYMQAVTTGPWQETGTSTTPVAGEYLMGRSMVRGGLSDLTNLYIRVSTGATTGTGFYVFYEVNSDGLPGLLKHATAAFALDGGSGSKAVAVGGIATAVPPGEYYCGLYTPDGVTGTPAIVGSRPATGFVVDIVNQARVGLQLLEAVPGTAPAADLSAIVFNGANNFNFVAEGIATLFGI